MNDAWQYWREALDALTCGKPLPPIDEGNPQFGLYKMRDGKNGPWLPVMIRADDRGQLRCRVGNSSDADPYAVWTYCAGRPISKEDAKVAFDTGRFPGEVATIGDNSGDRSLVEQLAEYVSDSLRWLDGLRVENQNTADQAANRRSEILKMSRAVEKEFDTKAAPHNEVLTALKEEYKPTLKDADEANKALRQAMDAFAKAEQKRLDDEQRAKYEAERRAAEAARAEIEKQRAKQMQDDPIAALTSPEPELPMPPPPPEPVKVRLGGQVGKVSGLRSYWEAEITDHKAALQHYANHPDVVALIQKIAKADVKNAKGAITIPGVRPYEDRRVG